MPSRVGAWILLAPFALMEGCGPGAVDSDAPPPPPSETTETTTTTPSGTSATEPPVGTVPEGLRGIELDPPYELPLFAVENQDHTQRTEDWLFGQPSVVWFYRDAATAG